jgi:hypothetical protein
VSAPNVGHHQAIIVQESEYIQKLGIVRQEIGTCTARHIENIYIYQEHKVTTVNK